MESIMTSGVFRMSEELEHLLERAVQATGWSRSEIFRAALDDYCRKLLAEEGKSKFDVLMQSGFQPIETGISDLSTNPTHLETAMNEYADRRSD
jgi:hypothetical protein